MDSLLAYAESLMASPWLLALVLVLALVDAVVPIMPAETLLITAGAFAVAGEPDALLVIIAGWIGAVMGDVVAHFVGRGAGPLAGLLRRLKLGDAVLKGAQSALLSRGGMMIVAARFIPGGRTATTVTSGLIRYPLRRFVLYTILAALAWAVYSVGIGMLGGMAFTQQPLLAVGTGIGVALLVSGGVELIRRVSTRRRAALAQRRSVPAAQAHAVSRRRSAEPAASPAPERAC